MYSVNQKVRIINDPMFNDGEVAVIQHIDHSYLTYRFKCKSLSSGKVSWICESCLANDVLTEIDNPFESPSVETICVADVSCFKCFGSGNVDNFIDCGKPSSECCGGCTDFVPCENCNGTGSIDVELASSDLSEIFSLLSISDSDSAAKLFLSTITGSMY